VNRLKRHRRFLVTEHGPRQRLPISALSEFGQRWPRRGFDQLAPSLGQIRAAERPRRRGCCLLGTRRDVSCRVERSFRTIDDRPENRLPEVAREAGDQRSEMDFIAKSRRTA